VECPQLHALRQQSRQLSGVLPRRADDSGLRRVDLGAKPATSWAGPPHAPDDSGLYEQDEGGGWWPTEAALEAGYQPCGSCALTNKKAPIVATPRDPVGAAAFIASAEQRNRAERGHSLARDELAGLLSTCQVTHVEHLRRMTAAALAQAARGHSSAETRRLGPNTDQSR
jgi:hypothetical protein